MGAGNPYATYAKCIKKDDKWATFMKKFEINEKEAKKFFKVFKRMDKKNKGEVNFQQFQTAWKVSKDDMAIARRLFAQMDSDQTSGSEDSIYFQEWAIMTFDFCTLRMDGLVEWTFKLFDPDGSGKMSAQEFKEMARLCMGDDVKILETTLEATPTAATPGSKSYIETVNLLRTLDKDRSGEVTLNEFRKAERSGSGLLFAAMLELQTQMQGAILGEKWWKAATKTRTEVGMGRKPMDIYNGGGSYERPTKGNNKKKGKDAAPPAKNKVGPVPKEDD